MGNPVDQRLVGLAEIYLQMSELLSQGDLSLSTFTDMTPRIMELMSEEDVAPLKLYDLNELNCINRFLETRSAIFKVIQKTHGVVVAKKAMVCENCGCKIVRVPPIYHDGKSHECVRKLNTPAMCSGTNLDLDDFRDH